MAPDNSQFNRKENPRNGRPFSADIFPADTIMNAIKVKGIEHLWELARESRGARDKMVLCPAHDDKNPSLAIKTGDDGRILLDCKAGCPTESICSALGVNMKDLFADNHNSEPMTTFDYKDASGKLVYQVCRFPNKKFSQRRPGNNGEYVWSLKGIKRLLYRLPELNAVDKKRYVFIPEGEKDVDRLLSMGLIATCNSGGAGNWQKEINEPLRGRRIIIIADHDEPGRKHSKDVAKMLTGIAESIKIIEFESLPESGDVSDFLNNGGTIEKIKELVGKAKPFDSEDDSIEPVMVSLGTVKEEQVEWLWQERIPQGKITLLVGDPGLGKSFLSLYMAAKVTTGSPWPDIPDKNITIGSVVILSAEDDVNDTILPRLKTAGANVNKIIAIQGVKHKDEKNKHYFDLTKHIPQLEKAVKTMLDVKLIIIDPLSAYLGATDSHKNSEVRGCLGPLAEMASKHKVAVLGISHLTKNTAIKSVYRVLGSVAFLAAARAVWAVAKDKDDNNRRLFCPIKTNLSVSPTSLAFKIIDGAVAVESGIINMTAEDILGDDNEEKSTIRAAANWLQDVLTDEPMKIKDLVKTGKDEGFNQRMIYRAATKLNIKRGSTGFGAEKKSTWTLQK